MEMESYISWLHFFGLDFIIDIMKFCIVKIPCCIIKVNCNTIELIVHTSCYCASDLLCVKRDTEDRDHLKT